MPVLCNTYLPSSFCYAENMEKTSPGVCFSHALWETNLRWRCKDTDGACDHLGSLEIILYVTLLDLSVFRYKYSLRRFHYWDFCCHADMWNMSQRPSHPAKKNKLVLTDTCHTLKNKGSERPQMVYLKRFSESQFEQGNRITHCNRHAYFYLLL